jgi:hypothetical protein
MEFMPPTKTRWNREAPRLPPPPPPLLSPPAALNRFTGGAHTCRDAGHRGMGWGGGDEGE